MLVESKPDLSDATHPARMAAVVVRDFPLSPPFVGRKRRASRADSPSGVTRVGPAAQVPDNAELKQDRLVPRRDSG